MSRTELVDVSVRSGPDLPVWPGSRGFHVERSRSIDRGDDVNESFLACDVHSGTHIDAPLHFLRDGATVDEIPMETLVGPAYVVDLRGSDVVTPELLDDALNEVDIRRLLIRTGNSDLWEGSGGFVPSYSGADTVGG